MCTLHKYQEPCQSFAPAQSRRIDFHLLPPQNAGILDSPLTRTRYKQRVPFHLPCELSPMPGMLCFFFMFSECQSFEDGEIFYRRPHGRVSHLTGSHHIELKLKQIL